MAAISSSYRKVMLERLSASMLCLALVLVVVMTAEASPPSIPTCPKNCPNAVPGTHSGSLYCLAHHNADCNGQNKDCEPCYNWRQIKKSGTCNQFHYSSVQGTTDPEWIIEPCSPVIGIESILDGTQAATTNFLWVKLWSDAVQGKTGTTIPAAELGLVMNSYFYRSQHQMHIHAAKLDRTFTDNCLRSLSTPLTDWESPKPPCGFKMVSKHTNSPYYVNYVIQDGANKLVKKFPNNGIDSKKIGALVSASPNGSSGFIVTVFEGISYRGDHEILHYKHT